MTAGTIAIIVIDSSDIPVGDVYELGIACSVFGAPQPDLATTWYDLKLCAPQPSSAAPGGGFSLSTPFGLGELATADTVIVPSVPDAVVLEEQPLSAELIEALRAAADRGARMVSLCNGAFALAEAGLLNGRRATAHWMHTATLAKRYPEVEVDDSVLYVDDGDVLTSAGLSAGLDLCLHLVRRDLGAMVANQLARRMVVAAHRPGGQRQFIDLQVPFSDGDSLAPVLQWAIERLDEPLTVDDLARQAGTSSRTFFRRLQSVTGTTPLQWLLNQRLARAQMLLESTDLSIEKISEQSGMGSATNLRRHFQAHVGVSPRDYRRAFPGRLSGGSVGIAA
ncbi:GlxA family transcriptional regulator [Streptomyces sp. ST2-7A]|uniref:GlxA family transcriptional regulator n=1 Tax=Streptomyces sp. ST2-7A TaxID=2907214 RepID=UPI001F189C75|nr:helix-turn-helix domain-containing protein [Streptomyces sp. ST2-7A]MCE7081231.1 helix-turn-helix domain-containing protein [Streptomyces sp. ST2-7A]